MAKRGASWKGRARVVRLLKRTPETVRADILGVLNTAAPMALAAARASTPRKRGALANALKVKVFPKTLKMNLGLLNKADNRAFYYGRILDRGRKAQTVKVKRRTQSGSYINYALRVKALPAARFDIVYGRVSAYARNLVGASAREVFTRALGKIGGGDAVD